jgi:hypothetical protein
MEQVSAVFVHGREEKARGIGITLTGDISHGANP